MDHLVPSASTQSLIEHGFAVLPGSYAAAKVARLRGALEQVYLRLHEPPLWSDEPQWLGDDLEVSGTGLVIHKLLKLCPDLHRDMLEDDAVQVLRGALGSDMRLEFAGAVVTNHTRPFFKWHNHVGGIEDEKFRRLGLRPPIETPERVAMIVYLDEMGPETGQLLIHPHRVSGASGPPAPVEQPDWDGRYEVVGPPGTVVMLDQTTWHAALPRTVDHELRFFFGLWFASASAPAAERVDESLLSVDTRDPLLRSLLPGGPRA
ncbi:hypothetical protein [Enhygromyxa salina]|uniref:Phytanoyl-CoA dioxygenase (PhyH) n=1 Tax=Enhygromyxa salina TaxID=215803 RepID=A0A2S9YIY9_9BACT|nr:hypothetical protein [Enhygromyxa salina]PRQ04996.1 hypothetical protein ENSA7_49290 [Enhygromyxa salina]